MVDIECDLLDTIHAALDAGWTVNRIAISADIPQSTLHRFVHGGTKQLKAETINRLCEHFGMRLTRPTRNTGRPPHA